MTPKESAVVNAAVKWASALEAQAQADEEFSGQDGAAEALREAEIELYTVVLEWRRDS